MLSALCCSAESAAALGPSYRSYCHLDDAFAGSGQVGRAGEAIVTGANDDHVPGARCQFADWHREADLSEDGGCGETHPDSIHRAVDTGKAGVERIVSVLIAAVTEGNSSSDSVGDFRRLLSLEERRRIRPH